MAVIFDANVLINLYHAEILSLVYHGLECVIPAEVYDEVITQGQQAGHGDAGAIAEIIGPCTEEPVNILPGLEGLGIGEASTLSHYLERQRQSPIGDDVIVSDDRQFLRYLGRREQQDNVVIRYLNTSQFIAEATLNGLLDKPEGMDALVKIRGRIPESHYNLALQRLELL